MCVCVCVCVCVCMCMPNLGLHGADQKWVQLHGTRQHNVNPTRTVIMFALFVLRLNTEEDQTKYHHCLINFVRYSKAAVPLHYVENF